MQGNRSDRRPLTAQVIVDAAIVLIERDGGNALSMRKVAAELGVGVMSLYNHVPDRDALIDGVARTVLAELDRASVAVTDVQDWKSGALVLVDAFRAAARRHPRSMYLVLTSRLDLDFAWTAAERALALLEAAGFDGETSVRLLRTIMSYLIGSQLMEQGALLMCEDSAEGVIRVVQEAPEDYPRSIALADELLHPDPEANFAYARELLLSAIERLARGVGTA